MDSINRSAGESIPPIAARSMPKQALRSSQRASPLSAYLATYGAGRPGLAHSACRRVASQIRCKRLRAKAPCASYAAEPTSSSAVSLGLLSAKS